MFSKIAKTMYFVEEHCYFSFFLVVFLHYVNMIIENMGFQFFTFIVLLCDFFVFFSIPYVAFQKKHITKKSGGVADVL